MTNLFSRYIEIIKKPKSLIILGVIGILLIFLSSFSTDKKEASDNTTPEISVEEYRKDLETDVKKIVKGITGDRNATVVITLESGISYEYADTTEDSKADKTTNNNTVTSSSEQKQGYITVKNKDGSEQALLVTAKMPQIRGVAIVCKGGDNELLSEKIENTVTAALNITSKRVYIAGGN